MSLGCAVCARFPDGYGQVDFIAEAADAIEPTLPATPATDKQEAMPCGRSRRI